MNEELNVKLKFDTSDVDRAKSSIRGITKETQTTTSATNASAASMQDMTQSLEQIRRLDAFAVLRESLSKVKGDVDKVKQSWGDFKHNIKNVGKVYKDFKTMLNDGSLVLNGQELTPFQKLKYELKALPILGKQVGKSLGATFKALGQTIKNILNTVYAKIIIIILAIKALTGIVRMVNEISELGAEIDDNAQKVQMSNEQYQKWSYIMKMCGSDMNQLQTAMNGMMQRLKSVDQGSEEAQAGFKKLGINVYDASGQLKKSSDLFEEAIEKLQGMKEGTERQVIANQIFGKSASNLAILLNTSNEQMKNLTRTQEVLGLQMSENAVQMSAAYQDAIDTMKEAGNSLKSVVAEIFLKPFTNFVKGIIKAITYLKVFLQTIFGLKTSASKPVESVSNVGGAAESAEKKVQKLKRSLMGFDELNVLQDNSQADTSADTEIGDLGLNDMKSEFDSLFSEEELGKIEKFKKKMEEWGEKLKNNPIIQGIVKITKKIVDTVKDVIDRIKGDVGAGINDMRITIEEIWKFLEPVVILVMDICTAALIPAIELVASAFKWLWGFIKATITLTIEQIKNVTDIIKGFFAFLGGLINGDMKQATDGLNQMIEGFHNCWKTSWNGIKDVVKNTWDFIKDIILKITDAISNVVNVINDFLGIDKNTRKNMGYTFTGGYTYTAMATGGIVNGPTSALIGEAGREAVLPLENNTGWMNDLADVINARQSSPAKIVLNVDGRELGYATINNINNITRSTGKVQLVV